MPERNQNPALVTRLFEDWVEKARCHCHYRANAKSSRKTLLR